MAAARWRSSRSEKVRWVMENRHLWSDKREMARQMRKAGLYAKETSTRDIVQILDVLIGDAKDCLAGDAPLDPATGNQAQPPEPPPTESR